MKYVCNGLLGLSVLLWAVTAGERKYTRYQAAQTARAAQATNAQATSQAAKITCAHEPMRFFSKYQSGDCLRRSMARAGRRVTA